MHEIFYKVQIFFPFFTAKQIIVAEEKQQYEGESLTFFCPG